MAARSEAWTLFARSNTGIVGSNPTWDMDVCVLLFCVYVVLCVGSGLATGCSPFQKVLPTVCRIRKLKSCQGPTKGCRAIKIIIVYLGTRWRWEASFTPRPRYLCRKLPRCPLAGYLGELQSWPGRYGEERKLVPSGNRTPAVQTIVMLVRSLFCPYSDCVQRLMAEWLMNWKGFGRTRLWPNPVTFHAFLRRNWWKPLKASVKLASKQALS
jgi:hypothetical protein